MSAGPPARPAACCVREDEVEFTALRAQGPGGQNVNKVSNAVQLRFDIHRSSLPDAVKARLAARADQRVTADGTVVIKAQTKRSLERNRAEALARLQSLVDEAAHVPRVRRATRPTRASKERRLKAKAVRADVKAARGRVGRTPGARPARPAGRPRRCDRMGR